VSWVLIGKGDGKMKEQLWYEEESIRKFGKTFSSSYTITEDDVNIVCSYCGKIFGEHFGIQCPKDVLL
jgi:hypothetical protein